MIKNFQTNSNNFFRTSLSLFVVMLISFFVANDVKAFTAKRFIHDTTPEAVNIKSNELAKNSLSVKDLALVHDASGDSFSDASYPGGSKSWALYLMKTLRYPEKATSKGVQGKVILLLSINERGSIKHIEAITGDPLLQNEAIRVVRNSGRWMPALKNSIPVESIREQSITFKLMTDESKSQVPAPATSDSVYTSVDTEASYPGGTMGWLRHLNKTFRYPAKAERRSIQGTVVTQFIVDKNGVISDLKTVSGPESGGLREEAIRVIKESGRWSPAIKDGQPVKSYKQLSISFRLER